MTRKMGVMAAGLLLSFGVAGAALAAPVALDGSQLDAVTAGTTRTAVAAGTISVQASGKTSASVGSNVTLIADTTGYYVPNAAFASSSSTGIAIAVSSH